MQFKSFMEALKGKQHKIDKNKNGEIDAHDFKLLRKEESQLDEAIDPSDYHAKSEKSQFGGHRPHIVHKETGKTMYSGQYSYTSPEHAAGHAKAYLTAYGNYGPNAADRAGAAYASNNKDKQVTRKEETIEESEERQARADYKTSPSGRKSHKEIVFGDAESKDDDKKDMKEELLDEGQTEDWKNIQSMDKGSVAGDKSSLKTRLGYLNAVHAHHKKYGNDTMKVRKEIESINKSRIAEAEELDEKSDQAKRNKTMKNMMDASRGARFKVSNPQSMTPKPDTGHKTPRDHNVAIGRALRALRNEDLDEKITVATGGANKVKKDEKTGVVSGTFDKSPPFDGPYTKTKPTKNSDGSVQTPMSRARDLAKQAMKQKMKEEFDIDMSDEQADSILECISEQHPIAPGLDRKYIRGTPEHKAYKATKKPINGMPTNKVKEDLEEVERKTLSYSDFVANLLEYESKDGVYRNKGTYGGNYVDPEGADDADDKKPKQQSAEKRGRGRPAGAKSGARKITGTSKLFK